ncbi:MAG: tyrosine-type recombinase/integrase [Enterococcus lemanii]
MTKIQKYKKKDGSAAYMFQAYLGKDLSTGKEKRTTRRGFKTKQEAKIALSRLAVQSRNPDFILESSKTFEEVSDMWLEQYKNTVKASTFTVQKVALKKHILPLFGNIAISKITIPYCQKQVNHWFSYYKKYSNLISITASIFQYAISVKLILNNPMNSIVRPKRQHTIDEEEYSAPYYNKNQLHEFLLITKEDYPEPLYLMFRILAYTGLRKGELQALRWKDIDFARGTLSVKQTLATVENWKLTFQPPKTRKSIRTLSLDTETLLLIKRWKMKQKELFFQFGLRMAQEDQLLFTSPENKPLYLDYLNHNLNKIVKENHLEKMTVHGFRHTHCSLLFESGATIKEVQDRMGHTDIKTTMNIYAHVTDKKREETADKFANFMGG